MLVQFRVANFRSFDAEQVLSMVPDTTDKRHPESVLAHGEAGPDADAELLRAVFLYGGNASGKSNLCRAMSVFSRVGGESATRLNRGDEFDGVVPFRLRRDARNEPSRFEGVFLIEGVQFRYGFEATREEIVREWLFRKDSAETKRESRVFEREGGDASQWKFGKGLPVEALRRTAKNATLLSRTHQESIEAFTPILRQLRKGLRVHNLSGHVGGLVARALRACDESPDLLTALRGLAQAADIGIDTLDIVKEKVPMPPSLREFLKEKGGAEVEENEIEKITIASGRRDDRGEIVPFEFEDESAGTQRFMAIALMLVQALRDGDLVFLDELECSLHPLLVRELRNLLLDSDLNPKGAQFVVCTHDADLLESSALRRDQIAFAEKTEAGATELFSLADLNDVRADEPFERRYLRGGYGGTPQFGNLREKMLDAVLRRNRNDGKVRTGKGKQKAKAADVADPCRG